MITGFTSLSSPRFLLLACPPSRLGGSYPAGRDPLRLVLRLRHRRQQLDAGVLQLIVDDHVVEELTVLRLDLTGGLFHLLEVFVLVEETKVRLQHRSSRAAGTSLQNYLGIYIRVPTPSYTSNSRLFEDFPGPVDS